MWKVSLLTVATCVGLSISSVQAQVGADCQLKQPNGIRQVAFSYESAKQAGPSLIATESSNDVALAAEEPSSSPSDLPDTESPVTDSTITEGPDKLHPIPESTQEDLEASAFACDSPAACPPSGCSPEYRSCEDYDCGNYGCDYGCDCGEKRSNPFTYGGWVSGGIYANAWGAKSNGPLTLREYGNGFTVNQTWFYFEKAIDNGGCGLDWGGRVDFLWGADGPDTQCFGDGGWDGRWFTSDDDNYGSALPQLYGELAYNDTSIKIGHFYTIIGYEVIPAPDNFFYSHSDVLAIEPFTHMGALATHKWNDRVTFHGGWVNGWDNGWLNPSGGSMFLGGASLELTKTSKLTYATSFGNLWDTGTYSDGVGLFLNNTGYLHSIVFETKLNDRLTYVFQSDFLTRRFDVDVDYPEQATFSYKMPGRSYGVNQYLFYELNEKLSAGMRVEWLRVETAIDYGPRGRISQSYNASELTLGLNYKPASNIIIRPEIRWDWYEGAPNPILPFNDNSNSYQFSGGFDMIVTY